MNQASHAPYRLYAHIGSPYSMKIRAIMRYRRLPHVVLSSYSELEAARQRVKVKVIPIIEYPDGTFRNDSTPLLFDLEKRHTERSIIPNAESDAFLAFLIEDMADELLTKCMYAYRWAFPEHTRYAAEMIAFDHMIGAGRAAIEQAAAAFEARQIGRNSLVGCTPENMPLILHVAHSILDTMESLVLTQPFLFGSRPSLADFAIFGQMSQYLLDIPALEPSRKRAPYTMRWLTHVHDLSGIEGKWRSEDEPHAAAISQLLDLAGSVYLPFLVANAQAFENGAEQLELEVEGMQYRQKPFKYQVKCFAELRKAYAALSAEARTKVDPILEKHNCLKPLTN